MRGKRGYPGVCRLNLKNAVLPAELTVCVCACVKYRDALYRGKGRGPWGGWVGWGRRTHKCVTLKTPVTGCHLLEFNPPFFLLRMFCANVLLFSDFM